MALVLKDRVKQAAAAPSTGTITLGATPTGFQSFASVGNGNTTYFAIVDPVSGDWEVNYGVYTSSGTTLSRNATPLSSSNAGSLVNFTGAVDVFLTYPSSRSVYLDAAGFAVTTLDINTLGVSTANISTANITAGTVANAPVNNTDIVNKQYADAIASGIHFHEAVNLATTAALPANTYNNGTSGVGATLTGNANGALSVDSTLTTASERILVKNEAAGANNGVYTVTQVGSAGTPYILTRATDFDSVGTGVNEIDEGDFFLVTSGTVNVNTAWVQQTPPPITIGTTALVFQQFSAPITYTAGTGLSESPTYTFNIANTTVTAATYGSASAVPVFAVNAQGQLTSVTNTAIAINGSAVTGAISGQAGSVANALTLGTYLTGGSFNGSAAVTATVDATSANTASKVVARDASGDFSAGTITATLSGSATSAGTATNIAGGAANQVVYQSASGTTAFATAPSASNQVFNFNGSAFSWSAGTISGVPLGSNLNSLTAGTYLTGTAYNGSAAQTWTVDATSANTASKVVARDASGDFSAGTITAALSGNASSATTATSATSAGYSTYLITQDIRTLSPSSTPAYRLGYGFTSWANNNTAPYADYLAMRSYSDGSGGNDNLVMFNKSTIAMRVWQQSFGSASAYSSYADVLMSNNYNSYAPTLTGTGASGTWGINVTGSSGSTSGNAATASRVTGGNLNPASTAFNNALISASSSNRVVTFDGNGSTPSVWWSNGSRAYGAIDAIDPGLAFWANNGTSWQQQMQVNYGNVTINTDIRSPIFYDSSDTGYYGDFASTSVLSNLIVNYTAASGSTATPAVNIRKGWTGMTTVIYDTVAIQSNDVATIRVGEQDGTTGGYCQGDGFNTFTSTSPMRFYTGGSATGYIYNGMGGTLGLYVDAGSTRAPIFYDQDNTGFYIDPASTSDTALRMRGGALFGPNTTWGQYLAVGGNGNISTSYASVATTDGNLHLDSKSGSSMYLNYYAGSNVYFGNGAAGGIFAQVASDGSFRSPIFYDYNNTGYYVDPASTSNLGIMVLSGAGYFRPNNWIQMDGNYGIYNTVYNGAHFLANAQSSYGAWRMIGSRNSYSGIYDDFSGVNATMFDGNGNGGIYREASGRWYQYYLVSNDCTGFGTSTTNSAYNIYCPKGIYSGGRVDGTIFYDSNNTAYYGDFASTSNFFDLQITGAGNKYLYINPGNGYEAMVRYNGGSGSGWYVGKRTTSQVVGTADFHFYSEAAGQTVMGVDTSGNLTAIGNVTAYSDERLKTDWEVLPANFVEKLAKVRSGTYTRIDSGERQAGVGAQSFQTLLPETVLESNDGTLSLAYGNAALASSVELAKYVTALEQRISQLEARL